MSAIKCSTDLAILHTLKHKEHDYCIWSLLHVEHTGGALGNHLQLLNLLPWSWQYLQQLLCSLKYVYLFQCNDGALVPHVQLYCSKIPFLQHRHATKHWKTAAGTGPTERVAGSWVLFHWNFPKSCLCHLPQQTDALKQDVVKKDLSYVKVSSLPLCPTLTF